MNDQASDEETKLVDGTGKTLCRSKFGQIYAGTRKVTGEAGLPTAQQLEDLPIHTGKSVTPANLEAIVSALPDEMAAETRKLIDRLFYPPWADEENPEPPQIPPSNLGTRHTDALQQAGIIEPAGPEEDHLTNFNTAFLIVEEKASLLRLRPILWTKKSNDQDQANKDTLGKVQLPRINEVAQEQDTPESGTVSAGLDLVGAYFQVELPLQARRAFKFKCARGLSWRMTRVPMGAVLSAALVQYLTLSLAAAGDADLARSALSGTGADRCKKDLQLTIYIDNIRVRGPPARVAEHVAKIRCAAACWGMTLQQDFSPDDTAFNFLGLRFAGEWVSPGEKLFRRLQRFAAELRSSPASLRAIEVATGRLRWCAQAMGRSLAAWHQEVFALRWAINALHRGLPSSSIAVFSRKLAHGIADLCDWVLQPRTPLRVQSPSTHVTDVFTDASRAGYGVALTGSDGTLFTHGQGWAAEHARRWGWQDQQLPHINMLEAIAVAEGLNILATYDRLPKHTEIRLRIDSTAALGAVRKGWSDNEIMAKAVASVHDQLRDRIWTAEHVPTEDNLADGPSRLRA